MTETTLPSLVKPTLLFLCHRLPYPPDKGEKIRAFRILEYLSHRFNVQIACFIDDPADVEHIEALNSLCTVVKWFPLSPRSKLKALMGFVAGSSLSVALFNSVNMRKWVTEYLSREKPKFIFVYSSVMAQFVLKRNLNGARLIMDFVDVDSDKWRQYAAVANFPMKWIYAREARKLLTFDRRAATHAEATLFVSEAESALFRRLSPENAARTHAIANGIDCTFFAPSHVFPSPFTGPGPHLVFTGTMDYQPNVDAVTWFVAEIFPRIQTTRPDSTFTIVGAKPKRSVLILAARPGVFVTGKVQDVRPYLSAADVVVAPLRIARGIQNKILEGMAMAKIVVTTPQGLEGIVAERGQHLLVAETAEDFAETVLEATMPATAKLGLRARQLMQDYHAWPMRLAPLGQILQSP